MTRVTKLPSDYGRWIQSIKDRVRNAQFRAMVAVNVELMLLYWDIGRAILDRQAAEGWGTKVVQRIATDLAAEFPGAKGFSLRNLKYMRAFAEAWPNREFVQQVVAQISWGNNVVLLDRVKDIEQRKTYARLAAENGWSRSTLVREIANNAAANFGRSTNNFALTMPIADSEAAIRAIRDSYDFTFLGLEKKTRKFKPQDVGQLSFYMTAIDEQVRDKQVEGQTVGILLCKSRNRIVVEYALKNVNQPIAVSTYELEKMGLASPQVLTDGLTKLLA